jgi:hypothetical protein
METEEKTKTKHDDAELAAAVTVGAPLVAAPSVPPAQNGSGPTEVTLTRGTVPDSDEQALWMAIRNRTDAIGFDKYTAFIERLFGSSTDDPAATDRWTPTTHGVPTLAQRRQELRDRPNIFGSDAYQLLVHATRAFLLVQGGIVIKPASSPNAPDSISDPDPIPEEELFLGRPVTYEQARATLNTYLSRRIGSVDGVALPYLKRILDALIVDGFDELPYGGGVLEERFKAPALMELIYLYWAGEESGVFQTMNAIAMRFQNKRRGDKDPLAELELSPLRGLGNLLWGFIQTESHRISLVRRAQEYRHEYGLELRGKAVRDIYPADDRCQFIEAFHHLIYQADVFFKEDADTTLVSDGFRLLNSLKQVHLILAQGAHNQYGDMPYEARAELLVTQFILSRPELREFLRGRTMVPYRERWMPPVDSMKQLQGWTTDSVSHFRDLGDFSEKLCLSIRCGDWTSVDNQEIARGWARYFKSAIQGYIHAYFCVTGVDLTRVPTDQQHEDERYRQPSEHLAARLLAQRSTRRELGAGANGSSRFERAASAPARARRALRRGND